MVLTAIAVFTALSAVMAASMQRMGNTLIISEQDVREAFRRMNTRKAPEPVAPSNWKDMLGKPWNVLKVIQVHSGLVAEVKMHGSVV